MVKDSKDIVATQIAVIANDICYIKNDIKEIKGKLEQDYVTQEEFKPIRNIVYGMVGLILTGVVGAMVALVLK